MVRISIRNQSGEHPQRIMDYVRKEDGTEYLEIKNGCRLNQILLSDFEKQIKAIKAHK